MRQDTLEGRAKTKNGVIRLCFSVLCILLEAAFIIIVITRLNEYAEIVNLLTRVFAGILVLALYASDQTSSMKMPWIILILVFPIMGVAMYLLIGLNGGTHKMRERYADIDRKLLPLLPDNREKLENIKNKIPKAGNISEYIWKNAGYPVYQNTDIVYYDEAVKGLEAQLSALSKAEKFIFMEYHAIEQEIIRFIMMRLMKRDWVWQDLTLWGMRHMQMKRQRQIRILSRWRNMNLFHGYLPNVLRWLKQGGCFPI